MRGFRLAAGLLLLIACSSSSAPKKYGDSFGPKPGGGGSGTVTSVAATSGGLLAVAGTPTVAPTVGLASLAASSFICNATGGGAVPTACSIGTGLSFAGSTLNATSTGSGPNPWFTRVATFVSGKVSTLVVPIMPSECDQLLTASTALLWMPEALTNAGTATTTAITSVPGGVIRCATGTTNGSNTGWRNNFGSNIVVNLRTAKYAQFARVKIVATASLFDLELAGFTDAATANVWIGATQATSAVDYSMKIGTATTVDLGTTFTVGAYATLGMIADGTNVTGYLGAEDGTSIAQIGTPQAESTAPNAAGRVQEFVQNFTSGANVSADWDKMLVVVEAPQ